MSALISLGIVGVKIKFLFTYYVEKEVEKKVETKQKPQI
jgi:hypothetical protein